MILGSSLLTVGLVAAGLAIAVAVYLVASPGPVRLPAERRRPGQPPRPGLLERSTAALTARLESLIHRRGAPAGSSLLELGGLRTRPQDFVFLVIVAAVVAFALGLVLGGPLVAAVLGALVPAVARLTLGLRVSKRQKAFGDQLDGVLQLMASNLRAGHSLPQALASVAKEAETPTAEELTRVVNETRVGRGLGDSLELTARRMDNEDFRWVAQAVAINREVGGNLADVLDGVARTIRERNEIRRHVAALSAEGRMSALILMILPVGVGGFLLVINPTYLVPLYTTPVGIAMLVAGVVLLAVGGLWLHKTVSIRF